MLRHLAMVLLWTAVMPLAAWSEEQPQRLSPAETASRIDALLRSEGALGDTKPADEAVFLRRASLDIIGRLPTTHEVELFLLDPDDQKRAALVESLLADPAYGRHWAGYWRDVILARRIEERALITARPLADFLSEELNAGKSWAEIATAFITATGDVREEGHTALVMAQNGQAEETAAEVARIFMGIQISCAQCHDHPYDDWKRQQFHELAAFFPRMVVRQVMDENRRTFEVISVGRSRQLPGGRRIGGEHYMPDLNDPTSRGSIMWPTFFGNQERLSLGSTDQERRTTIARWITSAENPWFAKAVINRLWHEMIGRGFYEPVDDLGPQRACASPETLDFLTEQFTANGYDLKWLIRTIAATEAYARGMTREPGDEDPTFTACPPTRLRSDQLFTNLLQAVGASEFAGSPLGRFGYNASPRDRFFQTFGFDPSTPREEISGSIPQALFLMNNGVVQSALDGRSSQTFLGRLLREHDDNDRVTLELYLRCLGREPSDREQEVCREYLTEAGFRSEGFEDILWALVNSTEFLYRR
jgi:hypothetical protein